MRVPPLTDRDFLVYQTILRHSSGKGLLIYMRGADGPQVPQTGAVRGSMYVTATQIMEHPDGGASITVMSAVDPKISFVPKWIINALVPAEWRKNVAEVTKRCAELARAGARPECAALFEAEAAAAGAPRDEDEESESFSTSPHPTPWPKRRCGKLPPSLTEATKAAQIRRLALPISAQGVGDNPEDATPSTEPTLSIEETPTQLLHRRSAHSVDEVGLATSARKSLGKDSVCQSVVVDEPLCERDGRVRQLGGCGWRCW